MNQTQALSMAPLVRDPIVADPTTGRIVHLNPQFDSGKPEEAIRRMIASIGRDFDTPLLHNSIRALVSEFGTELVLNVVIKGMRTLDILNFFLCLQRSGLLKQNRRPYDRMIEFLSLLGKMDEATQIFMDMPVNGIPWDEDSLATIIRGYRFRCEQNGRGKYIRLFDSMKKAGVVRTSTSYDALLEVLLTKSQHAVAEMYFHEMLMDGIMPTCETYCVLINGCFHMGSKVETAEKYFRMVKEPDVSIYNSMIDGYEATGKIEEAERMFAEMKRSGVMPNADTYACLIVMCCRNDRLDDGFKLYQETKSAGIEPTELTYQFVLDGLCDAKNMPEAFALISEMEDKHFAPKYMKRIYLRVMTCLCESGNVDTAVQVLKKMEKMRIPAGIAHYVILIDTFCDCGAYDTAVEFFDQLIEKDIIVKSDGHTDLEPIGISPIISYLCTTGQTVKAEIAFRLLNQKHGYTSLSFYDELVDGHALEGSRERAIELVEFMDANCVGWRDDDDY